MSYLRNQMCLFPNVRSAFVFVLACVAVVCASCVGFAQDTEVLRDTRPSFSRKLSEFVERDGKTFFVSRSAKLMCVHNVSISAQADGMIQQLMVDIGANVQKDQALFQMDDRVAKADMLVAERELDAARAQAEQDADIRYAVAAASVARKEYEIENQLLAQNASNLAQAQRKRLEAQRADLAIEAAEVKHHQDQLSAQVAEAKKNARKVQLDQYLVNSPYSGVILERKRDQGEWIRAGEPVLQLLHMEKMKLTCLVPVEGISASDLRNLPIRILIAGGKYEIPTKIEIVSPQMQSNRVSVVCFVDNQMVNGDWLLRDGMTVTAEITMPQR